jgi:ribonucleoside-diphosphate reductase alpha chain
VSFTDDLGDQWEEFTVHHPRLLDWMQATRRTDPAESPYAGATANDIDWRRRVRLQSVVQKFTTHSISSTINLPSTATVEEVGGIYLEAWKQGLKGITVYRDGSRSGVLVATEVASTPGIDPNIHMPRPERLEADVLRFNNDAEPWIAVVGLLNGKPYEIFTGKANGGFELPRWVNTGWVLKRKDPARGKHIYDLEYADADDQRTTVQGLSRTFNKEFWNYAILISGMLREGMPLPQVVDVVANLNLYDANLGTWKNGVVRALERYIPDGTQAMGRKCPECGDAEGLYYEEGCLKCRSCGGAKCG